MIFKKWWQLLLLSFVVFGLVIAALVAFAALLIYPQLPSLESITNYQPKLPLQIYSEDGYLIAEFGEERRAFVDIKNVPKTLISAILAIEDRRFYQHGGVDLHGVFRALFNNVTGRGHEGASTITMQVAKNFFTPPEGKRTLLTKIQESLLAFKIEKALSKDKILELYINQIYLGQRSYGFSAAAQVYFGKKLDQLTIPESALLAGLPKAPSGYNPFVNLKRAMFRQHEVLHDMYRFGFMDEATYIKAQSQPVKFKASRLARDLDADYVAEIIRQMMYEHYQEAIYSSGMKVYTTIRKANQLAANKAVLEGILEYDARHGYRGVEDNVTPNNMNDAKSNKWLNDALDDYETYSELIPAIILESSLNKVQVYSKKGDTLDITGKGLTLVKKMLAEKDAKKQQLKFGAVVRIRQTDAGWEITQLPEVQSSFVALDPQNGAVRALVGGFSFNRNKFNHVTQAWRQPGSSMKPFIYSAALEKGITPASIFDDAPFSAISGGESWSPDNYDGKYEGPMRVRNALMKSKNMVSVRILQQIGPEYAQDYISKFGFSKKDNPAYLSMALGAGSVTAWQMAGAYAVFANGGYRVKPVLVNKIVDSKGNVIEQNKFKYAGVDAPLVIDPRNAFLMTSMLQDVIRHGTATKANVLGRTDLAGKTGTTNDQKDTWFAGYMPKQVAIAWMGYDQPKSLGNRETGGAVALPIWIKYMNIVLAGIPNSQYDVPAGVSAIGIDSQTGLREEHGMTEYFYNEFPPETRHVQEENLPMGFEGSDGNNTFTPDPPFGAAPSPAPLPQNRPSSKEPENTLPPGHQIKDLFH